MHIVEQTLGLQKHSTYEMNIFRGFENVGCTQSDLQNYSIDIQTLLKDFDANVLIDNFRISKKLIYYSFMRIR